MEVYHRVQAGNKHIVQDSEGLESESKTCRKMILARGSKEETRTRE